jgi:hypothetical protein
VARRPETAGERQRVDSYAVNALFARASYLVGHRVTIGRINHSGHESRPARRARQSPPPAEPPPDRRAATRPPSRHPPAEPASRPLQATAPRRCRHRCGEIRHPLAASRLSQHPSTGNGCRFREQRYRQRGLGEGTEASERATSSRVATRMVTSRRGICARNSASLAATTEAAPPSGVMAQARRAAGGAVIRVTSARAAWAPWRRPETRPARKCQSPGQVPRALRACSWSHTALRL